MLNSKFDHSANTSASHLWKKLLAGYAVRLFLALTFLVTTHPSIPLGVKMALADDDGGDGGDGGGDDDDDDDDDANEDKAKSGIQRQRPSVPVPPVRARFEIVALGLDGQDLLNLTQRGYRVIQEDDISLGGGGKIRRLRVPARITIEQARVEVASQSTDTKADLNYYYRPQTACEGANCESHVMVNWQSVESARCGRTPVIGMVDTQIDLHHESLKDSSIEAITLRDGALRPSGTLHGTAVAALLVGASRSRVSGLVPYAKLIAVDPYHRGDNQDDRVNVYDLVRAIDLLVQRRPDVINLSLAGPESPLLEEAIDAAISTNVTVVAAAGNNGPKAKPVFPAAYDDVIAVTALDKNFVAYRRAAQGSHIDFSAPGVDVMTAAPGQQIRKRSGTSYAAPFVTAAAALEIVSSPGMSQAELVEKLSANARDLGQSGRDSVFGWGLIQATGLCSSP